jgi:SAM-dependent methyltransferase
MARRSRFAIEAGGLCHRGNRFSGYLLAIYAAINSTRGSIRAAVCFSSDIGVVPARSSVSVLVTIMDTTLYDELHRVEQTHWWFRARRHIVWSLVRRYIAGSENRRLRVCELGCGTGGNLAAISGEHDVVGVECSPHALDYARQTLGSRVRFGCLPHDIDLPPNTFDVVLMTDVLEHIEDDTASAVTALELTRSGGIVVATVPAYQWLYSPRDAHHHHFCRYGKNQFRALWDKADSQIELLSHYNTALFPLAAAARVASKLSRRRSEPGDISIPPRQMNEQLARLMQCEANLLGRIPMPFGLSLVAVVRKRTATKSRSGRAAA